MRMKWVSAVPGAGHAAFSPAEAGHRELYCPHASDLGDSHHRCPRVSFSGSRPCCPACPRSCRMKRRILFAMVLFGFALCASAQRVTAVRFQRLWDGDRVIDGALVLIENGRIRSVMGGNPSPPAGAEIIDWSRYYGLPGL